MSLFLKNKWHNSDDYFPFEYNKRHISPSVWFLFRNTLVILKLKGRFIYYMSLLHKEYQYASVLVPTASPTIIGTVCKG